MRQGDSETRSTRESPNITFKHVTECGEKEGKQREKRAPNLVSTRTNTRGPSRSRTQNDKVPRTSYHWTIKYKHCEYCTYKLGKTIYPHI